MNDNNIKKKKYFCLSILLKKDDYSIPIMDPLSPIEFNKTPSFNLLKGWWSEIEKICCFMTEIRGKKEGGERERDS